jgi:hypothetical protein
MAENINNIPTVETSSGNFGSTPPMTQDIGPNQNPMLNIPSSATNPANFSPDYQTVLDKIDFSPLTNMAYGPSPVNPETARLIEQAAIPINKVIQAPYNDLNSNYSGNVTGGSYNPGDLDLTTKQGRNIRLAQAFQNASDSTGANTTPGYQDPLVFGSKKFNYDRMMAHPNSAELGFHPLYDMEEYYNKNSHWTDDSRRMAKQWRRMFGNAFTSTYRNIGDALSGNWSWSDDEGAHIMEDAMRIGSSTRGGFTEWMHNTTLSSAYTVGIMTNIGVEMAALAGITALSGGTAAPATFTKAAQSLTSAARGIFNSVKSMSAINKTIQAFKIPDVAKDWWNMFNATKVAQGIGTAGKYTADFLTPSTLKAIKDLRSSAAGLDDMSQLAKSKKLFGAFYHDMRYLNLAVAEARLEAGLVENETFSKLYNEFTNANGRPPSKDEMQLMRQQSINAARTTFMFNAPIIFATNKLTIEKWMGKSKSLAQMMNFKGMAARFLKSPNKFGKDVYKGFGSFREMVMAGGLRHNAKYIGGAALRYAADGVTEGMQEVYQETVSAAATHYYAGLYQQPIAAGYDIFEVAMTKDSTNKAMQAVKHGIQHGPSFGVFASGFFTGMLVAPYSKVMFQGIPDLFSYTFDNETYTKNKEAREQWIKDTEKYLNEMAEDPKFYFDPKKLNTIAQKQLEGEWFYSNYRGDVLENRHTQEQMTFGHIYTALQLGKLDEYRSYINDMLKLDDQALEEAFADPQTGKVKDGYTAEDLRKSFDGINEKLDEIQENYDEFDQKFPNPFNKNKYEEGTREYYEEQIREYAFQHAKMQMIFNTDAMNNAASRKQAIENAIAEISGLSGVIINDVMVLTSDKNIRSEMSNLKRDIESLKNVRTPEDKKELASKKKKLKLLENFYDVLKDPENQHKSTQDHRNQKKIKQKGQKYEKTLNKTKRDWKKDQQKKFDDDEGKEIRDKKQKKVTAKDPIFGDFRSDKPIRQGTELIGDIFYRYEVYDDGTIIYNADQVIDPNEQDITKGRKKIKSEQQLKKHIERKEKTTYETVIDSKTGKPKKVKTKEASVASMMLKYKRDPKSMQKLMKVFTPYIEFLVEEAGGKVIDQSQMQNALSMIVDYGHLNFRIADMYKANEVLNDPASLKRYSERISIPMIRLWKKFKRNQGRRVRSFVDREIRKQYLKTLAKAGIFAPPAEIKAFLEAEVLTEDLIPQTYLTDTGEMIYDPTFGHTNQKQYEIMMQAKQTLIEELITPKKEDTDPEGPDTSTIDDGSTAEDALNENLTDDPKEKEKIIEKKNELNEFKNEDADTITILEREYQKYRAKQVAKNLAVLSRSEWLNQDKGGGLSITNARRAIYVNVYEFDEEKENFSTFNDWLRENIRSDKVQNIIEENDLDPYAVMLEDINTSKKIKDGVLLQGESDASQGKYADYDLFIVKTPGSFVDGKQQFVYTIRNNKGKNVYDEGIYNNLNLPGEVFDSGYLTLGEANEAIKAILKAIPENTIFKFDGISFKKGDTVSNQGKNYTVLSDVASVKASGKLVVRDEKFPEAKPIELAPNDFTNQGWQKEETSNEYFKEIVITGRNIQRLSHGKGLTFNDPLPFEIKNNSKVKNRDDLQDRLKNMDPEKRAKLQVIITRAKQPNKKHGEEVNMNFGEINPLIKKGSKRFHVQLVDPETGDIIGRLDGLSNYEFINKKTGKSITPLEMTIDNVFDYFRNYKSKTAQEQLDEIQDNYAQLSLTEDLFNELLKETGTEKVTVRFDSLQNGKINKSLDISNTDKGKKLTEKLKKVFVHVTPGSKIFTEKGKKDFETPLTELKYKYINKNGNMFILDTGDLGADISDLEYDDQLAIRAAIERQGLGGLTGRYILAVRTPNNMGSSGYFHLIELRTTSMSQDDSQKIFNDIISQQELTVSTNINKKGKVLQDKKKGLGFKFNEAFNIDLQNKMYIAMPHGHNFNITLQPSGDITFKFTQKEDAGGNSFPITLNRKAIKDANLKSMQDLLDLASNSLRQVFQNELNNNPQFIVPLGFGVELQASKLGGTPRNLQVSQIRNTIKADPTIEELHSDGVVAIAPKDVTGKVSAELRYDDPAEIERLKTTYAYKKEIERDTAKPSEIPNDQATFERYQEVGWHHYPKAALEALAIKMKTDEANLTETEKQIIAVTRLEEKVNKTKEIEVNVETETEGGTGLTGNESQAELLQKKKRIEKRIAEVENQTEERIEKEIDGSNPNLSQEDKNDLFDKAMEEWEKNPDENYKNLQKQKKDIDSKLTAGKIIRHNNYDGNDVVNLDEFIAWAKENLPTFITIEDIEKLGRNLASNGITVGTFAMTLKQVAGKINIDGKIYTGANQPFKYHEAFHAVFRMLLTEAEQKVLYNKAEIEVNKKLNSKNGYRYQGKTYKSLNELLKDFRKESPIYKNLTRSDLRKRLYEEYMADEFDKFKMNPTLSKTDSAIKNFFTRLIEMIKSIFRQFTGNDLKSFYEKIDAGKFRNTTIQDNEFTRPDQAVNHNPAQGITSYATKIIVGKQWIEKEVFNKETNKNELSLIEENVYMGSDEEVQLKNNIISLFMQRFNDLEGAVDEASLLKTTVRDYLNIYNPSFSVHKKSANYRNLRKTLKEKYENLLKAEDQLLETIKKDLALYDINVDLSNIDDLEIQDIEGFTAGGTKAWDVSANKQGGVRKLARALRLRIGAISMPASEALLEDQLYGVQYVPKYKINENTGEKILVEGDENLRIGIDAATVYTGMLKAAGNASSQLEVLQNLIMFGKNNAQTGAVVNGLLKDVGILPTDYDRILLLDSTEPVGAIGPVSDPVFLNVIIKQLSQFTSDYLRIEENTNPELGTGVVSIYAANHADDVSAQLDRARKRFFALKTYRWEHQKKAQRSREAAAGFADFISTVNQSKALTEQALDKKAIDISKKLRTLLGIDLSKGFIKYSLLHELNNKGVTLEPLQQKFLTRNSDAYAMTKDDASKIAGLLQNNIDILSRSKEKFSKETDGRVKKESTNILKDGAEGRLRFIFKGNAMFDENIGNSVFTDEKGDLIYSHQLPTYHLTKVAEINKKDIEGLDELRLGNGYLNANFLLNHPAFRQLVKEGKFKIGRVSGKTKAFNVIDPETKTKVAVSQSEGIPYSEFGDADFLTSLINLRLAGFDSRSNKLRKKDVIEENETPYVLAPVFIRVIADSSTGDLTYLPVLQSVKYNENGQIDFTDEFMDSMEALIENEYNRILENSEKFLGKSETVGTFLRKTIGTGDITGFNEAISKQDISKDDSKDRAFKITNNAQLVTALIGEGMNLKQAISAIAQAKAGEIVGNLPEFEVNTTLENPDGSKRLGEVLYETTTVLDKKTKKKKQQVKQTIRLNEFTLDEFYNQMFDPKNVAANATIQRVLNNLKKQNKELNKEAVIERLKKIIPNLESAKAFVLLHEQYHIDNNHYKNIEGKETLTEKMEVSANLYALSELQDRGNIAQDLLREGRRIAKGKYKPNTDAKKILEDNAQDLNNFDEAKQQLEDAGIPLREVMKHRLNFEFDRFVTRLVDLGIIERKGNDYVLFGLDPTIQEGFKNEAGGNLNEINEEFYFEPGELLYNLRQIFFDDYRNTKSINEMFFGDQAEVYKNVIEAIKRAKGSNASGMNVEFGFEYKVSDTLTIRPSYEIAAFTHKDIELPKQYSEGQQEVQDALVTMTLEGFAHWRAGLGNLRPSQAKLIDDLLQGRYVSVERLLGNGINVSGILKQDDAINSKKMVYDDGKSYIKMSVRVLTPDFTTDLETGLPREGMEPLHNLREKLESKERDLLRKNQNQGFDHFIPVIAVPESASKKFKQNLAEAQDAYSEKPILDRSTIMLQSKFMKQQQVVPSNKIEVVDPRQIINLLTNEQYDDNVEVFIRGEKLKIKDIKKLFNKDVGLRREFDFTNKRNLLISFEDSNIDNHIYNRLYADHIDKVQKGQIKIDLNQFRKFALNSLMSGKSKAQLLEFFEGDYNLNNPFTEPKFEELYFTFWKSGFTTKQPGYSLTLVSDVGYKVIKKVVEVDKETGEPTRWEVIPRETWEAMKKNPLKFKLKKAPTLTMKDFADQETAIFGKGNLKKGNYYLDNLRHDVMEYDSKGNPTGQRYTEFAMPPHHASILKHWKKGMPIADVLAKGFGIRIPTQDKHSAVNMKVVDWMPAYFGSSVIVPREVTEISGSDFDIDTEYTHFKEFFVDKTLARSSDEIEADWNKYVITPHVPRKGGPAVIRKNIEGFDVNRSKKEYAKRMRRETGLNYNWNERTKKFEDVYEGKFVEYGTADTITKEYKEYIRYMIKEAKKPGSDVYLAISKHQDKQGILLTDQFKPKDLGVEENSAWKEITEYLKEEPLLLNVLKTEMHLPDSLETYKEYKKFNNKGKLNIGGVLPYKGAYNNRILDYKFALLGNDNITKAKKDAAIANGKPLSVQNQPADLNPLNNPSHIIEVDGVKKLIETTAPAVWQLIQIKAPLLAQQLEESHIDIDNLYGKSVMKSANAMGTSIVGAAVQPNVITAIFSSFDIEVVPANRYKDKIFPLTINGVTYNKYSTNFLIDPKTGKQDPGRRKAYVISAIITALTDNAKEQLTGKTGLQVSALGIVVNMLALGVDTETAFGMINHPAVKDVLLEAGTFRSPVSVAISRVKAMKKGIADGEYTKEEIATLRSKITKENLWDDIAEASTTEGYLEELKHIEVLEQFASIAYTKEYTSKAIKLLELLKRPPKNLRGMDIVLNAARELGIDIKNPENIAPKAPPFNLNSIFGNIDNHMGELWQQTKELNAISPNVFIASSKIFKRLKNIIHNSSSFYGKQGEVSMDRVKNNIISYLMLGAYKGASDLNSKGLQSFKNSLIYPQLEGVKITEVVEKIKKRLELKGVEGKPSSNYFMDFYISSVSSKEGSEIDKVETNTYTKISDAEIMRIQVSLLELMDPNDPELSDLARSLISYLLVKDGMQYKAGSFVNAVPAHLFENFIVHLDRIQDVFKKLETIDEMTPAQRMSLKAELDNIVGEDFNNFSVSMIDNMMMHISSNQQMQRVFDSFSESSKPDSPIIFNKPTSNESASLILDITQGVGIGIRQDDSVVANVPTTAIDLTTVEGNIEILRKNNLIVQSPFAGSIPTFKYIFKYTYSVPGRVPGEFNNVTKIFKLNKIYSPLSEGEKGSRNNLFNVLDSTQLQGYRAEYIDVTGQQVGSVEQFAGGGLIGPVPLSTEIEQDATAERSTDKDKAKDSKGTKPQGNYENAMSYVKATEDGVEVTTVNGNTHNSNETDLNKAMDQEGEVGRGGSVLDLEAMVGKEEELPSEEEAADMVAEMEDNWKEDVLNMSDEEILDVTPETQEEWNILVEDLELRIKQLEEDSYGPDVPLTKKEGGETIKNQDAIKRDLKNKLQDLLNTGKFNEAEETFAEIYDTDAGQLEINFGDEIGASSKKMAKVIELWNSLSSEQQQEISKHYSITKFNEAWIKKNFGDMLIDKKPEEIIERLKKCS